MKQAYTKVLFVVCLLSIVFLIASPPVIAEEITERDEVQNAIKGFYDEIIFNQNYGDAEKYYKVPKIGLESNTLMFQKFSSPIDYFNSLYSHSEYTLKGYRVIFVEQLSEGKYHAMIELTGIKPTENSEDNTIRFTQDILLEKDKEKGWQLSAEDYPLYMKSLVEDKQVESLEGKEVLYKFFSEINKGNYGLASQMIDPTMSNLSGDSSKIISYLKSWHQELRADVNHLSEERLYIVNEFQNPNHNSTVLLVAAKPVRMDSDFSSSFGPDKGCNPCSSQTLRFIELSDMDGKPYLNLADADGAMYSLLNDKNSVESSIENSPEAITNLTAKLLEVIKVVLFILLALAPLVALASTTNVFTNFFDGPSSSSSSSSLSRSSSTSSASRSNTRSSNSQNIDIAVSVDALLAKDSTEPKKKASTFVTKKPDPGKTKTKRTVRLDDGHSASDISESVIEQAPRRVIYTDDE